MDPRLLIALVLIAFVAVIGAMIYFIGVSDRATPPQSEQRIELPNAIQP